MLPAARLGCASDAFIVQRQRAAIIIGLSTRGDRLQSIGVSRRVHGKADVIKRCACLRRLREGQYWIIATISVVKAV